MPSKYIRHAHRHFSLYSSRTAMRNLVYNQHNSIGTCELFRSLHCVYYERLKLDREFLEWPPKHIWSIPRINVVQNNQFTVCTFSLSLYMHHTTRIKYIVYSIARTPFPSFVYATKRPSNFVITYFVELLDCLIIDPSVQLWSSTWELFSDTTPQFTNLSPSCSWSAVRDLCNISSISLDKGSNNFENSLTRASATEARLPVPQWIKNRVGRDLSVAIE